MSSHVSSLTVTSAGLQHHTCEGSDKQQELLLPSAAIEIACQLHCLESMLTHATSSMTSRTLAPWSSVLQFSNTSPDSTLSVVKTFVLNVVLFVD